MIQMITSKGLPVFPRSFDIAPGGKVSDESIGPHLVLPTFSLAEVKSALVTRIRRSRRARSPASVHTALMSAPDKSSLVITNSSKSTSSPRLMRDVCNLGLRDEIGFNKTAGPT